MKKLSKGETTYNFILSEARKVFNKEGIEMTLKELSVKMDVTVGRITNHFPTKDHLFAGMSKLYQEEFTALRTSYEWNNEYTLTKLYNYMGIIMDLQYKHKSLMLYVNATGNNQKVMLNQITATWRENIGGFEQMISQLIQFEILKNEALDINHFNLIKFQFINLFTTWLVSFTIYDNNFSYKKMKPIYQKGIIYCLYPYMTEKGFQQLSSIS